MRKTLFLVLTFSICTCVVAQLPLEKGWKFNKQGDIKQYPASVPGTVHTDLLTNGLISDPFYGNNEAKVRWVDSCDWVYETTFKLSDSQIKTTEINLVFEGLDTFADVYVNDKLCASSENMFRRLSISLKSADSQIVIKGVNNLKVVFRSALKEIAKYDHREYLILNDEPRAMARKAQYHFGWDWGPKFTTAGIWRPVYIEFFDNDPRFRSISLKQNGDSSVGLQAKIYIPEKMKNCIITIRDIKSGKEVFRKVVDRQFKDSLISETISIDNPRLWYPNGMGEQYLYNFQIELRNGSKVVDRTIRRIGFKTVNLIREKDDRGETFYFKVNGKDLFAKGANWIPAESFLTRLTAVDYHRLIAQAALSNFNMLRVWGGGIYEDEAFYEACDEHGILVWQDFMFACAIYPATESFLANVRQEAVEQIQRISQHASLAVWCGNNENDEGWHNWGWRRRFAADSVQTWKNYKALFHELLPGLVAQYDPVHGYTSSSPMFGWGNKKCVSNGDSHYWGVWGGFEPFETYKQKVPRFMSEYGFQGFPAMSSLNKFIPNQELHLGSQSMRTHQKHIKGYETIQLYMEREYIVPDDLETYAYFSELLQAHGIKTAIHAHRRAKPYCMGSLYWQFNDCWPVVSWSGIDYYGQWKALQYFVKKAFAQHLVSLNAAGDKTEVWFVTDSMQNIQGQMSMDIYDFDGNKLYSRIESFAVGANKAKKVWEFTTSDLVKDTTATFCHASFMSKGKVLSEDILCFSLPKNAKYPNAEIAMRIDKNGNLLLTSDKFVRNLRIIYKGNQSPMSDNFFDMLPGKTYSVKIAIDNTAKIENIDLKALNELIIKTL